MARKKPKGYGYVHVRITHPKRPGRHSKSSSKRLPHKKDGIKVDIRSKNVAYITIGKWVIYIDNSTGEHIIESWKE